METVRHFLTFNKPTIIISLNNKIGKASARSILGFDIGEVILAAVQKKILIKGGGHKMAGGFSIQEDKIQKFKEFIIKRFKSKLDNNIDKNHNIINYYYYCK